MLLDIGVGILLGIAFDAYTLQHSLQTYVLVGVGAALAPDIDFIYHILSGGTSKDDHRHREILHNPIFVVIGWVVLAVVADPTIAWLFAAGATAHFLHDSIGIGWGVQWLMPFKSDHYSFIYRVHTAKKPKPPKRWVYVWPNHKLDELQQKYGDPNWFSNTYLRFHPFAVFETIFFLFSLSMLAIYAA